MPFGRHAGDHRLDDLAHDARCERGVDQRARRERAHAAGVRPAIVVEDPLVILRRCRSARARAPSQTTKNDTSGPVRHSSITSRSPAAPNRRSRHRCDDGRLGRCAIVRDHDAFAGGEPVGLQHDRQAELARSRRTRSASSSDSRRAKARGRHAVARHERLRERLARFEARGRGGRPEEQPARRSAKRSATPRLSGSSGPTTVRSICSRSASVERARPGPARSTGTIRASRGDARVPGRADELADVAVDGQPGDQRVLARAAAENENSH